MSVIQHYGGDTEEAWEKYVSDLENLPEEIKVIGVNDYLFIDGYEKLLEYKTNGRLLNIDLLLPVVELRLKIFAGNTDLNKINFHVVFSDKITATQIKSKFLSQLKLKYDEIAWNDAIETIEKLEEFGQKWKKISSVQDSKSDKIWGFNNATHSIEDIEKVLQNERFTFYEGNTPLFFTALGRSEWSAMRWESAGSDKKEIINKRNFVFTASPNVSQFNISKKSLTTQNVNSFLLHFSDAHDFLNRHHTENSTTKQHSSLGETFTWIKANPTFEGLRQITFEPEYRIRVQTTKPAEPLYQIKKIDLTFPETTKLVFDKNTENASHTFCFKGAREISFSPNLTCIIGGRGTGKSTLLGLLEKCIKPNSQPFFEKENLQITNEDKSLKINDCVKVDSNVDTQFIEFISQNEIESFAKNSEALTLALYSPSL